MPRIRPLPDGRVEVFRMANIKPSGFLVKCPACMNDLWVSFALLGIEPRECCGHTFQVEIIRCDAVVYKLPGDPSQEFLSAKTPFEASAT